MFIHFIKIFQASICRSIISRESQHIVVSHIESFIEKLRANALMIRHLTGIHCDKKETFKFNLHESLYHVIVFAHNRLRKHGYLH